MQQFLLLMDVLPWWMKKQVKSAMLVGYHWFMVGAERALYSDLGSDLLKTRIPVAYFKVGKRFLHLSKNPWMYARGHIWPHILRVKHSVCIVHLGTLGYVYRDIHHCLWSFYYLLHLVSRRYRWPSATFTLIACFRCFWHFASLVSLLSLSGLSESVRTHVLWSLA